MELLDDLQDFFFKFVVFVFDYMQEERNYDPERRKKREKKKREKEGRNTTESVNSISRRYNTVLGQGKTDRLVINVNKEERG